MPDTLESDPPPRPIGAILDDLGVVADLTSNDAITDVLVVAKVVSMVDGEVTLRIATAEQSDWITIRGLLAAARELFETSPFVAAGDDDD